MTISVSCCICRILTTIVISNKKYQGSYRGYKQAICCISHGSSYNQCFFIFWGNCHTLNPLKNLKRRGTLYSNKFPLMLIDACETGFLTFLPAPLRFVPIRKWGYEDIVADLIIALFLFRRVFIFSSFSKHFPLIEIASRTEFLFQSIFV